MLCYLTMRALEWTERNVRPFGWEDEWATSLFTFLIGPIFLACFSEVGSQVIIPDSGRPRARRVKKVPKLVIRVVLLLVAAAAPANAAAAVGSSDAMEKCGQNPL